MGGKLWRVFKAQLNVTPWAADSFLAFFYPMHFHPMCQIQLVTDFRSAEWAMGRKKQTIKLLHRCLEAWRQNSAMKVKVKYFCLRHSLYCLGSWFHLCSFCVWRYILSFYRCFWCNSPLSLNPPIFLSFTSLKERTINESVSEKFINQNVVVVWRLLKSFKN